MGKSRHCLRASGIGAALLAGTVATSSALACSFHTSLPERTPIDWLLESTDLVLARPGRQNGFAYDVVEVLRDSGAPADLNLLVNSAYRRALRANPDDAVLFARADDGTWRMVSYVDDGFREVMERVLSGSVSWGAGADPARFAIFADLHDDPDPDLRRLALLELDRAPYPLLRSMDLRLAPEDLLRDLWRPQDYPYQPIRILLLGLTGSDSARAAIHGIAEGASGAVWSTTLGATAIALVEIDGPQGVANLEKLFLSDESQPLDKLELVVEALAIQHGVAGPEVRTSITAALEGLVETRPEAAAAVARQFSTYADWSQADTLAKLVQERRIRSSTDLLAVAIYIAQARQAFPSGWPGTGTDAEIIDRSSTD